MPEVPASGGGPRDGTSGPERDRTSGRERARVGGTERSSQRASAGDGARDSAVRAGTVRAQARARARQGPRRDPQRVVRRRHPLAARGTTTPGPAATAKRAARATGGALGLSTGRRAAVLAVVVCALALTVAVPLRNYVTQRHEIAAVAEAQRRSQADVDRLTAEQSALADPAHVEALARERLGYARPGETPYRVELPGDTGRRDTAAAPGLGGALPPAEADLPWYTRVSRTTLGTGP